MNLYSSYRLKGKFTQRWLAASNEYYSPIHLGLFYAQYAYFKRKDFENPILTKDIDEVEANGAELRAFYTICSGYDDFCDILDSIFGLNRGFKILLDNTEAVAAMALIRLQIDNLTYLAAELKYPFRILYKVFRKGYRLSQIKIAGKNLNPAAIRKELDEQHNYGLCELYDKYSSFVHPDKAQIQLNPNSYYSSKKQSYILTKAAIKELSKDMIYINQLMIGLLQCQIFSYNAGLKDNNERKDSKMP
jgi:hypothetical protein